MQSSVDISLGIIQRFNLSNSEVEELMSRLSTMLKKGKEKPKKLTEDEQLYDYYRSQILEKRILHAPTKKANFSLN